MRVFKFRIKNYLNIESMELDLSPGMQGFTGENDQGKTNIITAIHDFLTGETDVRKVMRGKERAELELVEYLDGIEEAKVKRVFVPKKSGSFTGKGLKGKTPKSYITELFAAEAINPLYLISNDIVKYLKKHLPVKAKRSDIAIIDDYDVKFNLDENAFEECDRMITYFKDVRERTYGVMRHKREVVAELIENLPPKPIIDSRSREDIEADADKIKAEIAVIDETNKTRQVFEGKISEKSFQIDSIEDVVKDHVDQINEREAYIKHSEDQEVKEIEKLRQSFKEKRNLAIEQIKRREEAIERLKHQISENEQEQEGYRKNLLNYTKKDKQELENKLQLLRNEFIEAERAKEINKQYTQVAVKKAEYEAVKETYENEDVIYKHFAYTLPKTLISRADLPVKGVEFKDDELYVNNEHIDRLSSSNRHKVAAKLAAGLAKAKGHVALCLDGIEILDDKNRHEFMTDMQEYCKDLRFIFTRHGKPEYPFETTVKKGQLVK